MFDLLIQGGTIIDGTGQPRRRADLGIRADRIVALGSLGDAHTRKAIDATGLIVAPGFIDVHNHDEGWLLKCPHLLAKTSQGFTSEVLMSDGISYAPLTPELARDWIFYLRSLDALQTADYRGWRSIADYLSLIDGHNVQNVTALAPFANLRVLACGWRRDPADDLQINMMRDQLQAAMSAGAVGLSTGLDYIAQCFSSTEEIARVAAAMSPQQGVYVTHVRYKLGTLAAIQEAVEIGRRADVPVHISHLKSGDQQESDAILAYIDQAIREVDLTFDIYPYMSGSSLLASLLPYEVWEDGPLAAPAKLRQPDVRNRFGQAISAYGLSLERITIAWVANRESSHLHGQTLSQYVQQSGKPAGDALCDLLIDENFCVLLVFHVADDSLVDPFLTHPRQMLGSDGIWFPDGMVHPRVYGSATRMIGPLVRDRKLFTLEDAIRRMSSFPADRFGLTDRGRIGERAFADIVLFDEATVTDRARYDDPHHFSHGIVHVVVNGQPIIAHGSPVAEAALQPPGRALFFKRAS